MKTQFSVYVAGKVTVQFVRLDRPRIRPHKGVVCDGAFVAPLPLTGFRTLRVR